MDAPALLKEVQQIVPQLTAEKYKGQAGKIAVIGGCMEYTGAPYFAAISALKVGADLSHVFCTEGAATVIKSYSPELIVHPYLPVTAGQEAEAPPHLVSTLEQELQRDRAMDAINAWLDRFDVVVVGPGLGRDKVVLSCVAEVMGSCKARGIPLVVDADGLWLVTQDPQAIQGYSNAVLTPNAAEFRRLAAALAVDPESDQALELLCQRLRGPLVVRKGSVDLVSDGRVTLHCAEHGSLRRAGGQGDVLSGCIAAFAAWAVKGGGGSAGGLHGGAGVSPLMLAAYGGCLTTRRASRRAFQVARRSMGAPDVIAQLGLAMDELFDPTEA